LANRGLQRVLAETLGLAQACVSMAGVPNYRPDKQMTQRRKSIETEDIAFEALDAEAAVEKAITRARNTHRDNHRRRSTCYKFLRQSLAPGTKHKIEPHHLFAKALQNARDTAEPQLLMPKLDVRSLSEAIRIAFAEGSAKV
jgi:hypothetical protein